MKSALILIVVVAMSFVSASPAEGGVEWTPAIQAGRSARSTNDNNNPLTSGVRDCRGFGCYEGKCWAWCGESGSNNWCFTTKGITGDGGYVGCSVQSECNGCWNCAGGCGTKL